MWVEELYDSLKEMEDEYQWTQDPELKLRMLATARQINDLLINEKYVSIWPKGNDDQKI